jgi:hypothetical protein
MRGQVSGALLMYRIEPRSKLVVLGLCCVRGFLTVQASPAIGVARCPWKTVRPCNT